MTTPTIVRDSKGADDTLTKAFLRQQLLLARRNMSTEQKVAAETILCQRLHDWLQAHPVHSLGVYHPIRQEPDLLALYNVLSAQGVHLSLPIIRAPDQPLAFLRWSPGEALIRDALGTSVPASGIAVQPQALLIPCLGFNTARIRLGYGGGFYDRTLAQQPRAQAIGVAYAHGLQEFAGQAHDIALDVIITGP